TARAVPSSNRTLRFSHWPGLGVPGSLGLRELGLCAPLPGECVGARESQALIAGCGASTSQALIAWRGILLSGEGPNPSLSQTPCILRRDDGSGTKTW
ncbi:unnamed protein product, partial [Gulo gulo]